MPAARNYSSTANQVTVTGALTSSGTSMVVSSASGFPTPPFAGIIDKDRVTEEAVLVTAVVGTTFTISRGYDSTPAVAHDAGATFDHALLAIDLRDAGVHVGNSAGVHGVTGAVVGTTDAQTLTNKTLTSPAINGGTLTGAALSGGTVTTATISGGTLSGTIAGTPTLSGAVTFNAAPTFAAGAALGTAQTYSGTPTFSGAVTFSVAPTFSAGAALGVGTYSGAATFSGNVTFSGAPVFSGAVSLNAGGALAGTFSGSPTFSGAPTFSGNVVFSGAAPSFTGTPSFTNSPTSPANGPYAAWQTYTPTLTNVTGGTVAGAYVVLGKTLFFRGQITAGTATAAGIVTVTLPGAFTAAASQVVYVVFSRTVRSGLIGVGNNTLEISQSDGTNIPAATSMVNTRWTGAIEIA